MFLLLHRRSRRHPRGFTFLSVLMVLAIIAIMSQQYFATDPLTGEPFAVTQMERTRQTMELANLRTAKASYMMKTEGRTPDINRLRRVLKELPGAGGEGRYFVDPITHQLQSTSQMEMPDFRERLGLDIER